LAVITYILFEDGAGCPSARRAQLKPGATHLGLTLAALADGSQDFGRFAPKASLRPPGC